MDLSQMWGLVKLEKKVVTLAGSSNVNAVISLSSSPAIIQQPLQGS